MDLFLDTANLKEIKEGSEWGFLKGVTTNPSLIAKEGRKQKDIISEIVKMVDGPISAEVTANDSENRIKQGHELYQLDPKHIVISFRLPWMASRPVLFSIRKVFRQIGPFAFRSARLFWQGKLELLMFLRS